MPQIAQRLPESCMECGRQAHYWVRRKWPGKTMNIMVCGYHVKPYKTKDYILRELASDATKRPQTGYGGAATKRTSGYAPV